MKKIILLLIILFQQIGFAVPEEGVQMKTSQNVVLLENLPDEVEVNSWQLNFGFGEKNITGLSVSSKHYVFNYPENIKVPFVEFGLKKRVLGNVFSSFSVGYSAANFPSLEGSKLGSLKLHIIQLISELVMKLKVVTLLVHLLF